MPWGVRQGGRSYFTLNSSGQKATELFWWGKLNIQNEKIFLYILWHCILVPCSFSEHRYLLERNFLYPVSCSTFLHAKFEPLKKNVFDNFHGPPKQLISIITHLDISKQNSSGHNTVPALSFWKNPAYGRHWISWPMLLVGPTQFFLVEGWE